MKIIIMLFALTIIAFAFVPEKISDSKRGCIASAYQADQNGFDLKFNLDSCTQL